MSKHIVLGLGVTGRAVADYLLSKGLQVYGVEKSPTDLLIPLKDRGLQLLSKDNPDLMKQGDTLYLSPGIPDTHTWVQAAFSKKLNVLSEVELALRQTNRPLVAITGTNGKTTTTLLTAHVLNQLGYNAEPLGNVGTPLISKIEGDEIGVLELSSYQLLRAQTPKLKAACILNITPDHLDRHLSMASYAQAKFKIKDLLIEGGRFIVHEQVASDFKTLMPNHAWVYGAKSHYPLIDEAKKNGFERENFIAAFLLTEIFGISEREFLNAASTFKKPPHRMEWVDTVAGADFWNDSKGTNIDATLKAVSSMKGPVILIAGGVDKGHPYAAWKEGFKGTVKLVIVLGEARAKIKEDLKGFYPFEEVDSLEQAVKVALKASCPGDQVLLSPGCASFDMFKNYEARGDHFKSLVRSFK